MSKTALRGWMRCLFGSTALLLLTAGGPQAGEVIRYSCSAQVYEACEKDRIAAFTQQTGIQVEVQVFSSVSAVNALTNEACDVAATAKRLYYRHKEYGYLEFPFCKDPVAVIVYKDNPVTEITEGQIQEVFTGHIVNWSELGGSDQPMTLVVPGRNTAAYKNFVEMAIRSRDVMFDLMSYRSTMVVEVVKRFPWSISFIAQGAARYGDVKMLAVDGCLPLDEDYPYYQVYSFVTKGVPEEKVKKFIDFAFSEEGREIITRNGMIPWSR